jgi:hypothetical protein
MTADKRLRQCVKERSGALTSTAFFLGVRAFGGPNSVFSWRWGYGWNSRRGYSEISQSEAELISRELLASGSKEIKSSDLRKGQLPDIYPTLTGNYCYDEIYEYLTKSGIYNEVVAISKIDRSYAWRYRVYFKDLRPIDFRFRVTEKQCVFPSYSLNPTRYLRDVTDNLVSQEMGM